MGVGRSKIAERMGVSSSGLGSVTGGREGSSPFFRTRRTLRLLQGSVLSKHADPLVLELAATLEKQQQQGKSSAVGSVIGDARAVGRQRTAQPPKPSRV